MKLNYEEPNTGQTPVGQLRSRALGRGHAYLGHRVLLHFGAEKNQKVLHLMFCTRILQFIWENIPICRQMSDYKPEPFERLRVCG